MLKLLSRTSIIPSLLSERVMVLYRFVLLFLIMYLSAIAINAATITSNNVTGFWDAGTTWVGGVAPQPGDDVIINASATITVRTNVSCLSLSWTGNPAGARTLTVNAGFTLTVTGNITLSAATTNGRNRVINVLGALDCGGDFIMQASGNDARDVELDIGTAGVVTIAGSLVMPSTFARHHVDMTGSAVLNIGGNIGATATGTTAGGGFTTPTTINFNGTLPQNYFPLTVNAIATLKVNNSAGLIMRVAQTVTTLTIGDITSNSLFKDSGNTVTSTGTLNMNNGSTYRLGRYTGGSTATTFPAFTTSNLDVGTTIHYIDRSAAQTISTAPNYANLTLSTQGVAQNKVIAAGTLNIRGLFTLGTATTYLGSTNNPTVNLGGNFYSPTPSGIFTSGTGLFRMNGTVDQTIQSLTDLTFNGGLSIANSGGAIVTNINAVITIPAGDVMTINNGAVFHARTNIINGAGTFTLAAGGTLGIGSVDGIAATGTNSGNIQTTAARNYNTGANYVYNGVANQAAGNGLPATVNNLIVDNTGGGGNNTVTMSSSTSVSGNLSISNGILDLATFTANRGSAGGTLTVSDGTRLIIGGTNTLPSNFGTHFIGATSTIEYNGTTNTVAALNSSQTYGDLVVSASAATTANSFSVNGVMTVTGSMIASVGTITMSGAGSSINNTGTLGFANLTISGTTVNSTGNFSVGGTMLVTGTFNPAAASVISGAGTLSGTGTVSVTRVLTTPSFGAQYTITNKTLSSLTVDYNGAGDQTVNAENYGTLVISTNGTRTVTFENGGTIRVSNVFTRTLTTTTYVVTGNSFEYNGSGTQTITAFTYNNLIISNTGSKTVLSGTIVNCQTIEINDTAILTLPDTGTLNVQG